MQIIDIKFKGKYPSNLLSNFYGHSFELDGLRCASMEGFLQSLKFADGDTAAFVRSLSGQKAKQYSSQAQTWKKTGFLYWNGQVVDRFSADYQMLITRGFDAMATQNPAFLTALEASKGAILIHSLGWWKGRRKTVLTSYEFCRQLYRLRKTKLY